tara:strand:- start:136 stop:291 length:156 start_codon:yes stop_codon:yes gene_type:complete
MKNLQREIRAEVNQETIQEQLFMVLLIISPAAVFFIKPVLQFGLDIYMAIL